MAKLSKKQKEAFAKFDKNKVYTLEEAISVVKQITYTKFDSSFDIDVRLGVDPRKANQMVRGSVTLPHGTGKTVRVLVLCTPDKEEEAKAGKIDFKVDKFGIIHTAVGKCSFDENKILENTREVLQAIIKLKPSAAKGTYVKSITVSSTMSPGVKVDTKAATLQ